MNRFTNDRIRPVSGDGTSGATLARPSMTVAILSIVETASFAALLAAMAARNDAAVSSAGLVHGLLFAAYALAVWMWRDALRWSLPFTAVAILAGPVGAVIALERIRRHIRARNL